MAAVIVHWGGVQIFGFYGILRLLKDANRSVRLENAQWVQASVQFLGFYVGLGKIKPMHNKIAALQDLARHSSALALRSFLGEVGVYRKFIRRFVQIVAPIYNLAGVIELFPHWWTLEAKYAFHAIKQKLFTAPVLRLPRRDLPFWC